MNRRPRKHPRQNFWMQGFFPATLIELELGLRRLRSYLDHVSTHLDAELVRFRQDVENEIRQRGLAGVDADAFYEAYEDEFNMWDSSFPTTIRSSVLIAACSQLEAQLTDICKTLEGDGNVATPTGWAQLDRDAGIRRAAKFLRSNFAIHAEDAHSWNAILDYYKLRDCVVHTGGDIALMRTHDGAAIRTILQKLNASGIYQDTAGRLCIGSTFLHRVLDDMLDFSKSLEAAIVGNDVVGPVFWP